MTSQFFFWGGGHRIFLLCEALLSIVGGHLWGPRKAVTSFKSMLFTHETGIGSMVHWVCMRTMVYKVTVKTGCRTQNLHHLSFQSNTAKSLMKWRLCMRVYVFFRFSIKSATFCACVERFSLVWNFGNTYIKKRAYTWSHCKCNTPVTPVL